VRIDQPGKYGRIAKILRFRLSRRLIHGNDAADSLSFDQNGGGTHPVRRYYPAGKKGVQTHGNTKFSESSVRTKTEPSFISSLFQGVKIDN
jgi:hypothetical protein